MRICILTQPLTTNYGGLLQSYALQQVLKRMGHEVWTEDRLPNTPPFFKQIKNSLRRIVELLPIQKRFYNRRKINSIIRTNTAPFISKYITTTCPICSTNKAKLLSYNFDAYVVGSDQVWRPQYSYGIYNYFLDFTIGQKVRRIAYAASFGTDQWEYSDIETQRCAELIQKFDGVSVRESSGIELCKDFLNTKAIQVLDPTMLLEKEDYQRLVALEKEPLSVGDLFCYVLDKNEEKQNVIDNIASVCNLHPYTSMPKECTLKKDFYNHLDDYIYPSVTKWLRSFMDAKMVVTDSFHGCVFSIIFNKPFWVIGNEERGLARFNSLLSMFGLSDRLITSAELLKVDFTKSIDWTKVNNIRKEWQKDSITFLSTYLN